MVGVRILLARLLSVFGRRRFERDLEDEIQSHLAMEAEDNVRRGMRAEDAASAARRSFGGVRQTKDRYRDLGGFRFLESLVQDLGHGCRVLARNPAFTLVGVISLAIGIGANAATFSLADALLLRPLPVPDPGGLVTVGAVDVATSGPSGSMPVSYRDYVDIRDRSTSFEGLAASDFIQIGFSVGAGQASEVRTGEIVSGNYFRVMGVEPVLGRDFLPEETRVPERNGVIILSHAFWSQRFGADPDVIGRRVRLDAVDVTVIGVAPEGFAGSDPWLQPDFFVPLMMWPAWAAGDEPDPLEARDLRSLAIKGRLRNGTTLEQARAEIALLGQALADEHPETDRNYAWLVRTELEDRVQERNGMLETIGLLTALAVTVLLAACFNVAGLLGSRAPARAAEIALRMSLGAGRRRVIRQLVTENLLLAILGGLAGLGLGYLGVLLWRQITVIANMPIRLEFDLDQRTLVVSLVVAVLSVFLFGLTPAIRASRVGLSHVLQTAGGSRRRSGRSLLVSGQVAISLLLISVAGSMYTGLLKRLDAGPGFRTDHVLMLGFDPALSRYGPNETGKFYEQLVERSRATPGVVKAGTTSYVPTSMSGARLTPILPEGFEFPAGTESAGVVTASVGGDYFDVLSIPILRGRAFDATDTADSPRVAIVNEELAEHYWPDGDAVGKRFRNNDGKGDWVEVVGVVPTGEYFALVEPPMEFLYVPYAQFPVARMTLVAESRDTSAALAEPLRGVVHSLDPDMAILSVRTMEDFYQSSTVGNVVVVIRAVAAMALMAVGLAFAGLYGLVAYTVSTRTREIGIRMAVGATRSEVLLMVLKQGMSRASIGLIAGLILAFGVDQAMQGVFAGDAGNPRNPGEYLLWVAGVLAVTVLAVYLPARRAARIEPTRALRYE